MNIGKADVVISLNGRDGGKHFIVVGTEDEYSLIADGKGRRIEKPKRKKNKHLVQEGKLGGQVAEKLAGGEKVTNNEIRRALVAYIAEHNTPPPGEEAAKGDGAAETAKGGYAAETAKGDGPTETQGETAAEPENMTTVTLKDDGAEKKEV